MNLVSAVLFQIAFIVLTITTGIFGAAPLIVLYRTHPKNSVYPLQIVTIAAAIIAHIPLLALIVVCMNLLIWIYIRFENRSLQERTIAAVLAASAVYVAGIFCWSQFHLHQEFWPWVTQEIDFYIQQSKALTGELHVDLKTLVYQMPSLVIVMFALNMWLAALTDAKAQKKFGILKFELELKNFHVPETLIWFVIGALLFSFVKTPIPGLQEAALNALNMSLLLYFFQGISVVSYVMEVLSFGALLKVIVYFIFIAQLLLPICLGILDFWLNFRTRISKRKNV